MKIRLCISFLIAHAAFCAGTQLISDVASDPERGLFPSDALVAGSGSSRHINLPFPASCATDSTLSMCSDTAQLNELDGFSINPRVRMCFSGPINPATLPGN